MLNLGGLSYEYDGHSRKLDNTWSCLQNDKQPHGKNNKKKKKSKKKKALITNLDFVSSLTTSKQFFFRPSYKWSW